MKKQKLQKRTLLRLTPFFIGLVLSPNYSGILFAGGEGKVIEKKKGIRTEWVVEGMTCEGCAIGLQGGMAAVKGISDCTVDFDTKIMVCTIDNNTVKVDDIPGLVEKMGYKAVQKVKVSPDARNADTPKG